MVLDVAPPTRLRNDRAIAPLKERAMVYAAMVLAPRDIHAADRQCNFRSHQNSLAVLGAVVV